MCVTPQKEDAPPKQGSATFWFECLTCALDGLTLRWLIWMSQVWLGQRIHGELSRQPIYVKSAFVNRRSASDSFWFPAYTCSRRPIKWHVGDHVALLLKFLTKPSVCSPPCLWVIWCATSKLPFSDGLERQSDENKSCLFSITQQPTLINSSSTANRTAAVFLLWILLTHELYFSE